MDTCKQNRKNNTNQQSVERKEKTCFTFEKYINVNYNLIKVTGKMLQ